VVEDRVHPRGVLLGRRLRVPDDGARIQAAQPGELANLLAQTLGMRQGASVVGNAAQVEDRHLVADAPVRRVAPGHVVAERGEQLRGLLECAPAALVQHRRRERSGRPRGDADAQPPGAGARGLGEWPLRPAGPSRRKASAGGHVQQDRGIDHAAGQVAVHRQPVPVLNEWVHRDAAALWLQPEQ
jgi:hypothetical protein